MYADILVPCDGSPEAERAAEHALALAEDNGATLHALYVIETAGTRLGLGSNEAVDEHRIQCGKQAVTEVRERAEDRGVPVETKLTEGEPAESILTFADETNADLVVMGTHGRSGVERILIGSVAEQVVRASPVPVMTVGPENGDQSVTSPDRARQIAREQLAIAGHDDPTIGPPSRQRTSWVVHARENDDEYNVHISSVSGRAKLVRIN